MKYRLLGRSGLRVSEAALGTMTFGDEWGWGSPKAEAQKVYETYREAGGNFIDTANFYTNGTSEKFLGEFMQGHRDSTVLATKYSLAVPGDNPNAAGNQRKNMMQAVEASLKRLQTDYIDLYWVHMWDGITPVEEVMRGLDDLVRQGKLLHVGISDAPAWWVAQANTLAELRGWTPFIGLQIEYSLIERTVERELIPMTRALNMGVVAWSPLAGGVLSGKYHGGGKSDGSRLSTEGTKDFQPEEPRATQVVSAVKSVSEQTGRSMAQVALAWLFFPIDVPPLRRRKEDIPMLVEYFVERYAEKAMKQINKIDKNSLKLCQSYSWPGNIRELQNIIERSVILCADDTFWIDEAWFSTQNSPRLGPSGPLPQMLQHYEKELIEEALAQSNGKVSGQDGAAVRLGIPRSTLDLKIKQLDIRKHTFR